MTIGPLAYALCTATAALCAGSLLRAHARTRSPLLWWSGLCFVFLALNNALVVVDLLVFPDVDLFLIRNISALVGMGLLLYGLIWNSE